MARRAEFKPFVVATPVTLEISFKSYTAAELISYLRSVQRVDSHTIRFVGKDMLEASDFLDVVDRYNPEMIGDTLRQHKVLEGTQRLAAIPRKQHKDVSDGCSRAHRRKRFALPRGRHHCPDALAWCVFPAHPPQSVSPSSCSRKPCPPKVETSR